MDSGPQEARSAPCRPAAFRRTIPDVLRNPCQSSHMPARLPLCNLVFITEVGGGRNWHGCFLTEECPREQDAIRVAGKEGAPLTPFPSTRVWVRSTDGCPRRLLPRGSLALSRHVPSLALNPSREVKLPSLWHPPTELEQVFPPTRCPPPMPHLPCPQSIPPGTLGYPPRHREGSVPCRPSTTGAVR